LDNYRDPLLGVNDKVPTFSAILLSHMKPTRKENSRASEERPRSSRRMVILADPPVEELDIVGPWEVFESANNALRHQGRAYHLELASTSRRRALNGDSGLTLIADRHYTAVRGGIDTLIVSGGKGSLRVHNPKVVEWLRRMAGKARRIVSICTGAFLLAEAGLLNGRHATTHWRFARALALRYPLVIMEPDRIYVQDGHVYTSAGVTAGMDLSLALVEEDFGSAIALQVAQALVLFLRRPGGQTQFSAILAGQATEYRSLHELQIWMANNLRKDLSVENLADRVAMSPRNFARVFVREVGVAPARFVGQLRVEAARRVLETSDKGLEEIAGAVGFSGAEAMRRTFHRCIGALPQAYRERFKRRERTG
jgi:transcriptional regulator GlxA family with amidase domain